MDRRILWGVILNRCLSLSIEETEDKMDIEGLINALDGEDRAEEASGKIRVSIAVESRIHTRRSKMWEKTQVMGLKILWLCTSRFFGFCRSNDLASVVNMCDHIHTKILW